MHDLVAELRGYRDELAEAETYANTVRAQAVRDQIGRVTGEITELATDLEAQATQAKNRGADGVADELAARAGRLRQAVAELPPATATTADNTPLEHATPTPSAPARPKAPRRKHNTEEG
ncbi:hypothetical protein D5S17_32800 [Pseudonocardiaceae bacterium YIM PH 21723]|nr:hypothetical protein D5S17_32800 [Pseudonocardiaceae bacterium YIM PH 21723]